MKKVILGVCLVGTLVSNALADTLIVATCNATDLKNAINQTQLSLPGDDIIELKGSCEFVLNSVDNSVFGPTGLPVFGEAAVTINGHGAVIRRDPTATNFRIGAVNAGARLTLNAVSIEGGALENFDDTTNGGGGLYVVGQLVLNHSTVQNNSAYGGGGIVNFGKLSIRQSTIQGNTGKGGYTGDANLGFGGGILNAGYAGIVGSRILDNYAFESQVGGVANSATGTLSIVRTTIKNNSARGVCGGLLNSGTLSVVDSTITKNKSDNEQGLGFPDGTGGGLCNGFRRIFDTDSTTTPHAVLTNSTVSGNSAVNVGGIDNWGHLVLNNVTVANNYSYYAELVGGPGTDEPGDRFANSIGTFVAGTTIVKNSLFDGEYRNCRGTITGEGNNFANDGTCGVTVDAVSDIGLKGLAANGGPTRTHALKSTSVAINAATDCTRHDGTPVNTDQRRVHRPWGRACDAGAFEFTKRPLTGFKKVP